MEETQEQRAQKELIELRELMEKQEDLDPELVDAMVSSGPLGPMIQHPLVQELAYIPQMNAMYNKRLKMKQDALKLCEKEGEWMRWVYIYERPYRFQYYVTLVGRAISRMSAEEFWDVFWSCWADTENFWQNKIFVKALLRNGQNMFGRVMPVWECSDRSEFGNEEEIYDSLPDTDIAIYRGHQGINADGYCWSLSPYKANWFARRFDPDDSYITRAVIDKADILSVLNGRHEMEVAIRPDDASYCEDIEDSFEWPAEYQHLADIAKKRQKELSGSLSAFHGPVHWLSVLRNAMAICDVDPHVDRHVCTLFAIFHDCCRISDAEDPEHGPRAAKFVQEISDKLDVTDFQLKTLTVACHQHTSQKRSSSLTVGACFDADRLDLSRDSKVPSYEYLSTEAAKQLRWKI